MADEGREFSSFRDPSGVVFRRGGVVLRQIAPAYKPDYRALMESGLYEALVEKRLMIPHKVLEGEAGPLPDDEPLVIKPKQIPYISYPYEWCFAQYQAAALTTLRAHRLALDYGMILKDASAYNIQFLKGRAVLIDTLSFERLREGEAWVAYGQFCRHFAAPLLLMQNVDWRLGKLMQSSIDGIPLDLADTLLGRRGGAFAWQHIHMHARAEARHAEAGKAETLKTASVGKAALVNIADALLRAVQKLKPPALRTEWGGYRSALSYSAEGEAGKEALVREYLAAFAPKTAWDLGANDGRYSRLAVEAGAQVVAFDIDPAAVQENYLAARREKLPMLPLLLDLSAPSPAIGFANAERQTIGARQTPDVIMMLAVVHHMAISNNLPFEMLARWLASLSPGLIIEFVPKDDEQVRLLLRTREDIFPHYDEAHFEAAFGECYRLAEKKPVPGSRRTLYRFIKYPTIR